MSSMFGELPSLGFSFEVLRDEGPVEGCHPVRNVVALMDPGLIVGVVRGELDSCEVVNVVVGVPIT